jgi:hypothetical protein
MKIITPKRVVATAITSAIIFIPAFLKVMLALGDPFDEGHPLLIIACAVGLSMVLSAAYIARMRALPVKI